MASSVRKGLLTLCLAGALLVGFTQPAEAWWGCGWLGGCYYPAGVGPYCGWGYWYLGWRPGPIRRLLFGPYRWYWSPAYVTYDVCCWGGYDCCVHWHSRDCCCDWCDCCEVPSDRPHRPAAPAPPQGGAMPNLPPAAPSPEAGAPSVPAPGLPSPSAGPTSATATAQVLDPTSGQITVYVPRDARVIINGLVTKSTGTTRTYVSRGLQPGKYYKYEITAELSQDGRWVTQRETVYLTAGNHQQLAFHGQGDSATQLAQFR